MKKAKYLLIFLVWSLSSYSLTAQQRIQFSQYMVNQYVLNPAAGGIDADLDLTLSYRKQWVNFKGAPRTMYFTGNMPVKGRKHNRRKPGPFHSVGTLIFSDRTGPLSKNSLLGSYSYNLPLNRNLRLATGVFFGITQVSLDHTELEFDQAGESFNHPTFTLPDASAGMWFYGHNFYLGGSVNQLFYNRLNFLGSGGNLVYHYYLTGGYKISAGRFRNSEKYLVPSLMLKYGGKSTSPSVDLNLKFNMQDFFWLGTSYRMADALVFIAGIRFKNSGNGLFEFSYSYDLTHSRVSNYTSGSHELILRYQYWNKKVICPQKFW